MFKKIVAMALCVLVLAGSTVAAIAQPTPRYKYISTATATISISSGKAKVVGVVKRTSSGTEIDATIVLQQYDGGSWTEVDSWSSSSTSTNLTVRGTSGKLERGKYRAIVEYTVYGPAGSESGSKTSSAATY